MAEIDYSKGKIPGAESGIEIRHSVCDICTPGMHCGLDVYVKDGKVHQGGRHPRPPQNKGKLCTKGLGNRQYLYREDRILTPLRRVGERGEGKFEPISWDEAIDTIAEKLLSAREEYGAPSGGLLFGIQQVVPVHVPAVCRGLWQPELRHRIQQLLYQRPDGLAAHLGLCHAHRPGQDQPVHRLGRQQLFLPVP